MRKKKQPVMVEDCMSKSPVTISSSDSLQSAIDLLLRYNIRELPVIDFGRLASKRRTVHSGKGAKRSLISFR